MIGTIYTSVPCGTTSYAEPLEDGIYSSVNGRLTNLGVPALGNYFIDYRNNIMTPTVVAPPTSGCPPPMKGVYISDGATLSRIDPGTYEIMTDSIRPYAKQCPPPAIAPAQSNGDLLLAALIGGFVGNSLEKNLSGNAEDIEEEEYQLKDNII